MTTNKRPGPQNFPKNVPGWEEILCFGGRPPLRLWPSPVTSHAGKEVRPAGVVAEEGHPLDTAHHHVVQDARGIQTRLARHEDRVA